MMKDILAIVKTLFIMAVGALSVIVIFNPNPSLHSISILVGMIGILITTIAGTIDNIDYVYEVRKDFQLIDIQNVILSKIELNNKQVISLISSQADLLYKMTDIANKTTSKPADKTEIVS